jgi:hypothetical protein
VSRPRKRAPRGGADAPITADVIRAILKQHVLKYLSIPMPSDREIEILAWCCEGWRIECGHAREIAATVGRRQEAVRRAVEAWQAALADLEGGMIDLAGRVDPASRACLEWYIDGTVADRLIAERAAQAEYLNGLGYGWNKWQNYGAALAGDLCAALRLQPANPDEKVIMPAARFLAALAPLLSGEQPTLGSVKTQLKTMATALSRDDRTDVVKLRWWQQDQNAADKCEIG